MSSVEILSVADLMAAVSATRLTEQPHAHLRVWFRGQGDSAWLLKPSVYRDDFAVDETSRIRKERHLTQDFVALSAPLLSERYSDIDLYFIQQHHRMPTRLLDWTTNPLAALYFALEPDTNDGSLFLMDAYQFEPFEGLATPRNSQLVGAVAAIFDWKDDRWPDRILPVRPSDSNYRIKAQRGCFTFHPQGFEEVTAKHNKTLQEFLVPKTAKASLKKELQLLGFDEFTIYGDLDSLAQRLKRAYA